MAEHVRELRLDKGMSQQDVAFAAHDFGVKMSIGTVSQVETGRIRPEVPTMEVLARVLGAAPEEWAEYRLALARRQLDEREVGLEQALANLARLEDL